MTGIHSLHIHSGLKLKLLWYIKSSLSCTFMISYATIVITDTAFNLCVFVFQVIPPVMFIFCTNSCYRSHKRIKHLTETQEIKSTFLGKNRFVTSQNNINRKKEVTGQKIHLK